MTCVLRVVEMMCVLHRVEMMCVLTTQVMDMVDITWGVAAYLSNGEHVAGDLLLGKQRSS